MVDIEKIYEAYGEVVPDEVIVSIAMREAYEKFLDTFEDFGIDPAFFEVKATVYHISSDFEDVLQKQTFDWRQIAEGE